MSSHIDPQQLLTLPSPIIPNQPIMLPLFAKTPAPTATGKRAHVAVCPFFRPPHPEIFFLLSRKIAAANRDVEVSMFTDSLYNMFLNNYLDPEVDRNLHLFPVEWPWSENATQEELAGIYMEELPENLRKSMAIAEKVIGEKFTYVVADAFLAGFCHGEAEERGVGWSAVWTSSAAGIAAYLHGDEILRKINESNPSGIRPPPTPVRPEHVDHYLPGFPPSILPHELPRGALGGVDPIDKMFQDMVHSLPKADTVLVDSFLHLESSVASALLNPNFHLGGPFSLNLPFPPNTNLFDTENTLSWLETRATSPGSVVYINLGNAVTSEMQGEFDGLADALEATGIPFLFFVPRFPPVRLPEGFVERTSKSGQGKVVTMTSFSGMMRLMNLERKVLRHEAVGAHLREASWWAVSESLASGKPIICRPMSQLFDQMLNAAMVDRVWGIGVGVENYSLSKDTAERALRRVMVEDEGKEIKAKISVLRKLAEEDTAEPKGSSTLALNKFISLVTK